jgi:hypothetical protein
MKRSEETSRQEEDETLNWAECRQAKLGRLDEIANLYHFPGAISFRALGYREWNRKNIVAYLEKAEG